METITKDTPIVMLTVGQLQKALKNDEKEVIETVNEPKRYVYGIDGIRKLFNVSHVTAIRYKNTIIKDAVSQQGKIIVTDAEKAMELFRNSKK